jgi:poly(beta-D-mannuronate) C5 epimerase
MDLFTLLPSPILLISMIFAAPFYSSNSIHATTFDPPSSEMEGESFSNDSTNCATFDSEERIVTITCKTSNLSEISNQLVDQDILYRDETLDKGWILNAGITIAENATLYINSTDTSWLKIVADGETAYPITISGSLKIDSVKVTSWNPITNNYTTSQDSDRNGEDVSIGTPRPYIVVEESATGTTDITNSEIAYLGYESGYGGGRTGLRYEGGDNSIVSGNNIHNLYFAFYSKEVGGMKIENNRIHNNIHYGLDPHTGTHNMLIKNNTVHDNGSIGIICSLDCYNIVIEDNKVYNNTKMGIMLSRNMYDSFVRNNTVSHEDKGIVISESHNNEVHDNSVSTSGRGIDLDADSSENKVYDNLITDIGDPAAALYIEDGAETENTLYSNLLRNSSNGQVISLGQGNNATSDSDIGDEDDNDNNSNEND